MTGGTSKCLCNLCVKMSEKKKGQCSYFVPWNFPFTFSDNVLVGHLLQRGRKPRPRPVVDSEGTPDVYRMAIQKLKEYGTLDEKITEPSSMDWRAERKRLSEYLTMLNLQASYIPRAGEIVLWTPSLEGELSWNYDEGRIEMYSQSKNRWLGPPEWRAGVIGQVPEEDIVLQDLVETTKKKREVNYSGFRVETFPNPNGTDKSYSLQYKYVHLRCIKPFNAWELFLQGTAREALHPSIENALTIMSSFSFLDKYRFRGTWPNATVYSRGIFIGAELLLIGDAVRLKPTGYAAKSHQKAEVTDIMVIESIRLELTSCVDDPQLEQLAERYAARIQGPTYTTSRRRAQAVSKSTSPPEPLTHDEVIQEFQYVGMSMYGNWYRLNPPGTKVEVSQDMIVGRCYEPDSMALLFGRISFGLDVHGVLVAREYSRRADERIPKGKRWFWGDFRTQTLAIDTLNGQDVGHYSESRDVGMWRANLKVIDGKASVGDLSDVGRLLTKPKSTFHELHKTSTLVSSGLDTVDVSNPVSSAEDHEQKYEPEESESEEDDFSIPLPYIRGGTEETELGDYVPENERKTKKAKTKK